MRGYEYGFHPIWPVLRTDAKAQPGAAPVKRLLKGQPVGSDGNAELWLAIALAIALALNIALSFYSLGAIGGLHDAPWHAPFR